MGRLLVAKRVGGDAFGRLSANAPRWIIDGHPCHRRPRCDPSNSTLQDLALGDEFIILTHPLARHSSRCTYIIPRTS